MEITPTNPSAPSGPEPSKFQTIFVEVRRIKLRTRFSGSLQNGKPELCLQHPYLPVVDGRYIRWCLLAIAILFLRRPVQAIPAN